MMTEPMVALKNHSYCFKACKPVDHLTENGVIVDWREPAVIRMAPVPLYNRFSDVAEFLVILENGLRESK